jgi:hypothetical protein
MSDVRRKTVLRQNFLMTDVRQPTTEFPRERVYLNLEVKLSLPG